MKYIVYLTTNLKAKINGINRIYVGVHQTENPEIFDGYIGCGVKILHPSSYMYPKTPFLYAVKKYGVDAFKREILFMFDTSKEAYLKEREIVNLAFIQQSHVYNVALGGDYNDYWGPLYQFDYEGNLIKIWTLSKDAYEFYGYSPNRWNSCKRNKCSFLDSYWATSDHINISDYSNKSKNKITYLYDINGKMLEEFESLNKCAKTINYDVGEMTRAIKEERLILKKFYVSYEIVDEFKPKPRKLYVNKKFYVYTKEGEFKGEFIGKELMSVINLNSWNKIKHIFTKNHNWYKDFYISETTIETVPKKRIGNGILVDVYTKYGEYIETINSIKEAREKYNIPSSKLKHILNGEKYFGDYIFKYSK